MSYGQRINRLLFKIQQAERLDSLQLATALMYIQMHCLPVLLYLPLMDSQKKGVVTYAWNKSRYRCKMLRFLGNADTRCSLMSL